MMAKPSDTNYPILVRDSRGAICNINRLFLPLFVNPIRQLDVKEIAVIIALGSTSSHSEQRS